MKTDEFTPSAGTALGQAEDFGEYFLKVRTVEPQAGRLSGLSDEEFQSFLAGHHLQLFDESAVKQAIGAETLSAVKDRLGGDLLFVGRKDDPTKTFFAIDKQSNEVRGV